MKSLNIMTKSLLGIVAVLLLLFIPILLYFLRPVMGALLLTFAIAFVLMYPIRWLQRLKLTYRISVLLIYFLFLIFSLIAIGWFMVSAVTSLVNTLQSAREFIQQITSGVGSPETGLSDLLSLDFLLDGMKALSVAGAGLSLLTSPGDFVAAIIDRISAFTGFVSGYPRDNPHPSWSGSLFTLHCIE